MALIYFDSYPKIPNFQVGCLFRVSKNVSESYFPGACISNSMDLEGRG